MRTPRPGRGFTLIEMAIVAAIAGIILMAVVMMTSSTDTAYQSVKGDTEANFSLRRALNRIADELRQSSSSIVTITAGVDYDAVDLQVPVSSGGTTVNWGAAGQTGWHILYLVEDRMLIRRVVDGDGLSQRVDEVLADDVDKAYQGQKGFSVTENEGLYVIALRVAARRGQTVWRRSETTSVVTRN